MYPSKSPEIAIYFCKGIHVHHFEHLDDLCANSLQ